MRTLTHYELVHEEVIRDGSDDILDWKHTVLAEGKTIAGLVKFARMKKLNPDEHLIEANYVEAIDGYKVPDSDVVGYLNDPEQLKKFKP